MVAAILSDREGHESQWRRGHEDSNRSIGKEIVSVKPILATPKLTDFQAMKTLIKLTITCTAVCLCLLVAATAYSNNASTGSYSVSNSTGPDSSGAKYIAANGSDGNPGTADKPWRSLKKARSLKAGTDVFLRCGDRWTETWQINWEGTSSNKAIIGAYRSQNQHGCGSQALPQIDGKFTKSKWVNANKNAALLLVQGTGGNASHVIIQDLHIHHAEGNGLALATGSSYNTIRRNKVAYTGNAGISGNKGKNNVFEYNDVSKAGQIRVSRNCGTNSSGDCVWPGAMMSMHGNRNLYRGNRVHDTPTEGIGLHRGDDYSIVEFNVVWNTGSVGIYNDSSAGGIVRYNYVFGTASGADYLKGNDSGLTLRNETKELAHNAEFYGNVVVGKKWGMRLGNEICSKISNCNTKGIKIYNNTLIDNQTNFGVSEAKTFETLTVKNNILYQSRSGTQFADWDGKGFGKGLIVSHNIWSGGTIKGVLWDKDQTKMKVDPKLRDFAATSSVAKGKGADVGSGYKLISTARWSQSSYPSVTLVNNGRDIGAYSVGGSSSSPPPAPVPDSPAPDTPEDTPEEAPQGDPKTPKPPTLRIG